MQSYQFVVSGGSVVDGLGKAHWPACLRFEMNRGQAFGIVQELIAQLRNDENDVIAIDRCGELTGPLAEE